MKKLFTFLLSFVLIISITSGTISSSQLEDSRVQIAKYQQELLQFKLDSLESSNLTMDGLIKYLDLKNIENKTIVLRQVILESGWLKSTLTIKHNNLLGMRFARVRETTAIGEAMHHAEYDHWTDSIKDYILWKTYWETNGYDTSNYYEFLNDVGYATATYYIPALKSVDITMYI